MNDTRTSGTVSRRVVLRRAAAGSAVAGAAWVAPSVVRLDAAVACGTCTLSEIDWEALYANNDPAPNTTVDGVRLQLSTSDPGGQGAAPNFVVQTQAATGNPFGAAASWYQLRQNAVAWGGTGDPPSRMVLRFTFRNPSPDDTRINLNGVCLTLLDVDNQSGSGWNDRIYIDGVVLADDTPATIPTFTPVAASPPGPTGLGTLASPLLGVGTANIVNASTDGNVLVQFGGPVNQFDLWYTNGTLYSGSVQRIGITAVNWCDPSGGAPAPPPSPGASSGGFDWGDGFVETPPQPGPGPEGGD